MDISTTVKLKKSSRGSRRTELGIGFMFYITIYFWLSAFSFPELNANSQDLLHSGMFFFLTHILEHPMNIQQQRNVIKFKPPFTKNNNTEKKI